MDVNKTGRITYVIIMIISGLLCNTLINTVIFLYLIHYNAFIAQKRFCTIVDLDASFKVYLLSLKFITAIDKFEFITIIDSYHMLAELMLLF